MLTHQQLLDLGTSSDLQDLQRRLVAATECLGFSRVNAVLIRGSLQSGRAWIRTVENTPPAYLEAQRSLDATLRDPVMSALQRSSAPVTYDQSFYVQSGAGDLWDVQAPFDYRCGIASAVHSPSHAEQFLLGIDRPDALSRDAVALTHLTASFQLLALYTHEALMRLSTPTAETPALSPIELECLKWASGGRTVWQIGRLLSMSEAQVAVHQRSAARKLGASSVPAAVLRCIDGGLLQT